MVKNTPTYGDEIDLINILKILWEGKLIISFCLLIGILCGFVFNETRKSAYESKLQIKIDNLPPFYEEERALHDFEKLFFSKKIFNEWKNQLDNNSLEFENFSKTDNLNGFVVSRKPEQLLAHFVEEKKLFFILIKTNKLKILNDFFNYAMYVNNILKSQYVVRSKQELHIIETRFKNYTSVDTIISKLLDVDRFIVSIGRGGNVLNINRPSVPKKVTLPKLFIYFIALLSGGIIGSLLVFSRKVFINYENKKS